MFSLLLAVASGIAIASHAADPQPARNIRDLYHWFTADDYPVEALSRRAEGTVGFRLIIDAEGSVSGCSVESSSGDPDLDRVTCEILRNRARYYPARDSEGRATQGSDTGRVTWRLPPEQSPPAPLTLAAADLEGVIRLNGPQLACRTTANGRAGGPTVLQMCELLVGTGGFDILRRSVAGTEFSAVLSIRPGASGGALPAAGGSPLFAIAAFVTVRPDGSVTACTPVRGSVALPRGFPRLLEPCALFPAGPRRYFAAEPSRTRLRSARLDLRYYLRPRQELSLAPPAPAGPTRARANLSQFFTADDFPEAARLRGAEGTVAFRVGISAEGRVTDCAVTRSSGDTLLDEITCTILRDRARYQPARDPGQRPVASTDEGRVTWRLPPGYEPASMAPTRYVTRLRRVGPDDLRCTIVENGVQLPGETRGPCGDLRGLGAEALLRAPAGPSEITYVSVVGGADAGIEVPGADEAGYGQMAVETVVSLSVAPDGQIVDCRVIRDVQPAAPGMELSGRCDFEQPGGGPYFLPSTDTAPRRARMRTAIFVK